MKQKSIDWLVEQIENQQKFYIELAKKDKTKRKEVDAILTATTLLRMKCGKAKEIEKQQSDDYAIEFAEFIATQDCKKFSNGWAILWDKGLYTTKELLEIFKKEKGL